MLTIYLPLVAASLLIGLPVAYGIVRNKPQLRMFGYMLAGCIALLAIHVIMKVILGLSGIAATRSIFGLLAQGIAGAAAGFVFCKLAQPSVSD
jgi:ABC-type spermidine/putrescine transport system permease subunit I